MNERRLNESKIHEIRPNEIKLIALDMDGTTLGEDSRLSERTCHAIQSAIEQGVEVVVATGRMLDALPKDVLAQTDIRYAITSNGANVVDLRSYDSIYVNTMDAEAVERVLEVLDKYDLLIETFVDGRAYIDEEWVSRAGDYGLPEFYLRYALATRRPVTDLFGFMRMAENGVENINIDFGDLSMKPEVYEKLSGIRGITITSSFAHNWEIGAETASKGDGMRALCDHLSIPYEATMACGDNENDLAMIKFAALGVAVGNAVESLRLAADYVVASNKEDGVAEAIERFVLEDCDWEVFDSMG